MFCYQREFNQPTEVVTRELFCTLVDSVQTRWLTNEHRRWRDMMPSILADEALQAEWARDEEYRKWCYRQEHDKRFVSKGKTRADQFGALTLPQRMQAYCDNLKKSLPFVVFVATYAETENSKKKVGRWRKQAACHLNGLCVIDFDHIEGDIREVWNTACNRLSDEEKAKILFVFVTPSGHGLKVVFKADVATGNLIDNQKALSLKLGLNPDESCKDASRGSFLTSRENILLINEEQLFTYENPDFSAKFDKEYHAGHSQPTQEATQQTHPQPLPVREGRDYTEGSTVAGVSSPLPHREGPGVGLSEEGLQEVGLSGVGLESRESLLYNGVALETIIAAWMEGRELTNHRHDTLVELTSHLRYLIGNNPRKIEETVRRLQWVLDLEAEGENVSGTVSSVCKDFRLKETMPKPMRLALEKTGATNNSLTSHLSPLPSKNTPLPSKNTPLPSKESSDVYDALPLGKWAAELQEMAEAFPCMKELFLNVHPYKTPAVLFSAAALFGTLMTRTWYHFWYEPEVIRRLNYSIFIIGNPGAGKNIIEKFYKKIADPMIQSDKGLIDAVNRYKEGRTERTTSTKAQKDEALKRPVVGIRVHPARTATGEFIRHMQAAVTVVQGQPLNLHMFSFDAELDNVTKQNKGGDWKDREVLELKAFHNEEDGQMYANSESVTGMFNVYWNFIYTGTPYALHRKVNQRNFGTGMSTRLAVIPLPDVGTAKRHQPVVIENNETLKNWAYRLDRVEGEIPIEPLNDETYDWQSARMEIAEFNGDKADRTLLKRIPYYGIGISLPFILMRHWEEWQSSRTLTMDETDKRLCRLAMDIQYRCQQFFFGEMAFNYFADQNKEFVQRRRTTRYDECFRKLPEEFNTKQFMECFNCSAPTASRSIARLLGDGVIKRIKYGSYHKVLAELP